MESGSGHVAFFLFILSAIVVYSNSNRVCSTGHDSIHPRIECQLETDSISTFVLGDWGGKTNFPHTTEAQRVCANFTSHMGPQKNPDFFTGTGDNFYYYGINATHGVNDLRFWYTFENAFPYGRGDHGEEKIPWYIILGNHDYYGDVRAQVEYSQYNSRWVLPDYSYSVKYTTSTALTAEFIFIDTQILCGGTWDHTANVIDPRSGRRGRRQIVPVGPANPRVASETFDWINRRLENAYQKKVDYVFVVGHYPIFSTVFPDSECLVNNLLPMMHQYKATGYIAGHEHNLQYMTSKYRSHVLHHLLSGAVHETEAIFQPRYQDPENNPWDWKSETYFPQAPSTNKTVYVQYGAMMHMELTSRRAKVEFYSCSHYGSLHDITIPKRRWPRAN